MRRLFGSRVRHHSEEARKEAKREASRRYYRQHREKILEKARERRGGHRRRSLVHNAANYGRNLGRLFHERKVRRNKGVKRGPRHFPRNTRLFE